MDIYAKNIIDHYRCPRHRGKLSGAQACCRQLNRSCGDDITAYLKLEGENISAVSFEGSGCAISTAGISILTDTLVGKSRKEVLAWGFEEIKGVLGIEISPRRYKCAMIGLGAVQGALQELSTQDNDNK